MLKEKWKILWSRISHLEDYTPEVFVKSQWQQKDGTSFYYVIYRWIFASIFLCGLLASMIDIGRDTGGLNYFKWPVYLTNWGYTICTIQASMAAYHVTKYYKINKYNLFEKEVKGLKMKTSYSIYWVLHSIGVVGAITITSIYWTLIFNPNENKLDFVNLTVHLFNSIFMLVDLLVVAHPTKLIHCYWALSFASLYIIFNALYYLAGGTDRKGRVYIYNIMDWRKPLQTIIASLFALLFLMLVTVLVWLISLSRRRFAIYLSERLSSKNQEPSQIISGSIKSTDLPKPSISIIRVV